MFLVLTLTSALLAAVPAPTPVDQASLGKARELFQSGNTLFAQGRFAAALSLFEEAWKLKPHPTIQFNLARCHEQLGDPSRALRAYREYLKLAPDAADREGVFSSIARLERKMRERGLQQLTVEADRPEAQVKVDDVILGKAPATTALPLGPHRVVVTAEGFEPFEKTVQLQLTQATEVTVALQAVRPAVADAPRLEPTVSTAPVNTPPPAAPLVVVTPEPKPHARVWTWVAGGVAVAGVGVATGLMIGASSNARELNTLDPARTRPTADGLYSGYQSMTVGSDIAWAVAGTAAVTTLILFLAEK
jgi:tetratricopeptide (TPR) repeat protein